MTLPRRLLLTLPAALAATAAAPAEKIPVAATPISRMDTPWWRTRHLAKLDEVKSHKFDLIWLGDSITQNWESTGPEDWRNFAPTWQRYYGDRNALNLGFKGDTTAHLLWRMQNGELDNQHPKAAIILIGANNMGRVHWNAPQTIAGIEAVIAEAQKRMPGTKLLLLSVLPSIRNRTVDRTTTAINHGLTDRFATNTTPGVTYVDVTRLFMKDGTVDRTQFLDDHLTPPDPPLHPTPQAMARIADAMEPALSVMMGDKSKAMK